MLTVIKLEQTCFACPAQWDGKTDTGQGIYIRYRYGYLRLDVDGEIGVYGEQVGDGLDGGMSFEEMSGHLKEHLTFKLGEGG